MEDVALDVLLKKELVNSCNLFNFDLGIKEN